MLTSNLAQVRLAILLLLLLVPCAARDLGESAQLAGLNVTFWKPARTPAPLVLFSHGFHGNSRQSTFLCAALAQDGYLVVAPNHRDARSLARPDVGLGQPTQWTDRTFQDRAQDIARLLKALHGDPRVDGSRGVALVGHSLGAYTMLGVAGAWPSWKQPGVACVLALSPYAHPFNTQGQLSKIGVPVMYQTGTLDVGVKPFLQRTWKRTSSPAFYVEFQGAAHFAWTDLNPEFQPAIIHYSEAFLDHSNMQKRLPQVADLRSK